MEGKSYATVHNVVRCTGSVILIDELIALFKESFINEGKFLHEDRNYVIRKTFLCNENLVPLRMLRIFTPFALCLLLRKRVR